MLDQTDSVDVEDFNDVLVPFECLAKLLEAGDEVGYSGGEIPELIAVMIFDFLDGAGGGAPDFERGIVWQNHVFDMFGPLFGIKADFFRIFPAEEMMDEVAERGVMVFFAIAEFIVGEAFKVLLSGKLNGRGIRQ